MYRCWALTCRPTPRSAELDQLLDDLVSAGASTIHLAPLSPDDVHAIAFAARDQTPGPELADLLAKAGGGNPLWVVEILRSLAHDDWLQPARVARTL